MITVTIYSNDKRESNGFEISGHALSDVYGRDLVCAGASAIAFGAVNAIAHITGVNPTIDQGAEGGYLKVTMPEDLNKETYDLLQVVMNTMVTQFYTMTASYSDFIELKYKMV